MGKDFGPGYIPTGWEDTGRVLVGGTWVLQGSEEHLADGVAKGQIGAAKRRQEEYAKVCGTARIEMEGEGSGQEGAYRGESIGGTINRIESVLASARTPFHALDAKQVGSQAIVVFDERAGRTLEKRQAEIAQATGASVKVVVKEHGGGKFAYVGLEWKK